MRACLRTLLPLSLAGLLVFAAPAGAAPASWPDLASAPKGSGEGVNDAALIIAIEAYSKVDRVVGAGANADDWFAYFLSTRGIPARSIVQVRDADATDVAIRREAARVAGMVKPGGTLWVLYVGHGAPSKDGSDGLLVGVDADRSAEGIYARSVPQRELFAMLDKGAQAQTVAVVDACFSGQSASGQALVSGLQPLVPTALAAAASGRTRVLTATGPGEFSGPLPGAARPAFSYLALGALRGWADADGGNGDGVVSAVEVRDYVQGALGATVRGRRQTPELLGSDLKLGKVVDRAAPDLAALSRGGTVATGTVGGASVQLGGGDGDLARLAAEAAAKAAERERYEREAREADAKLGAARRARLDAAAAEVRAAAAKDYAAVKPLLALSPLPPEAKPVLEAFVSRYGAAKVSVDGVTEAVAVAELDAVKGALARSGKGAAGSDWVSPTLGTMKWIPAGTFTMGSPESEAGRDSDEVHHKVTLTKGFWLMEHEVTQGEWQAVMGSNPVAIGSVFVDGKDYGAGSCKSVGVGPNLPVACVSWEQAVEFAKRVSARDGVTYRLPTEAEWEYAARGGQSGAWAGASSEDTLCAVGNVANAGQTAGYRAMGYDPSSWTFASCEDGHAGLAPVGSFRANGYGLYDMSGNVFEWTADWYGAYPSGSGTDPQGATSGSLRVYRGGGWNNPAQNARVADRFGNDPGYRNDNLGVRLTRTYP